MPTDRPLEMFLICTKKRIGPKTVPWGTPDSTLDRAEKSAEAFREQKFNRMCVPEVSNQIALPAGFLNSEDTPENV